MPESNVNNSCPICHSERTRFLFEGWDLFFGYPDPAMVYQCRECDHVFVAGILTPEQLTYMYTNHYDASLFNIENYEPYKEKKGFLYWLDGEEWCAFRHVPKNVRVLDIGCGCCETLGYHKTRGCEVFGVEINEVAQKVADRYGFNVHIGLFDPSHYEPESFDYVTMDEVFEHIVYPLKTLREINSILKPGGFFVASAPNPKSLGRLTFGKRWGTWCLPFHRHFYSRRAIEILAKESGFVVHQVKSSTESCRLLDLWGYYFCAAKPGQKAQEAVQWKGTYLSATEKQQWHIRLYMFLKRFRVLCLPMRIADLFGIGDMNLIVLKKKNNTSTG